MHLPAFQAPPFAVWFPIVTMILIAVVGKIFLDATAIYRINKAKAEGIFVGYMWEKNRMLNRERLKYDSMDDIPLCKDKTGGSYLVDQDCFFQTTWPEWAPSYLRITVNASMYYRGQSPLALPVKDIAETTAVTKTGTDVSARERVAVAKREAIGADRDGTIIYAYRPLPVDEAMNQLVLQASRGWNSKGDYIPQVITAARAKEVLAAVNRISRQQATSGMLLLIGVGLAAVASIGTGVVAFQIKSGQELERQQIAILQQQIGTINNALGASVAGK